MVICFVQPGSQPFACDDPASAGVTPVFLAVCIACLMALLVPLRPVTLAACCPPSLCAETPQQTSIACTVCVQSLSVPLRAQ